MVKLIVIGSGYDNVTFVHTVTGNDEVDALKKVYSDICDNKISYNYDDDALNDAKSSADVISMLKDLDPETGSEYYLLAIYDANSNKCLYEDDWNGVDFTII